eukprot:5071861-Amphidinium_carterae.1
MVLRPLRPSCHTGEEDSGLDFQSCQVHSERHMERCTERAPSLLRVTPSARTIAALDIQQHHLCR